jgi:glycosyltransferase involved in cell wall biosynthesis
LRLLVDAAAADYGGIRTYVEQLLGAWAAESPTDELLVVVPSSSPLDTAGHRRHELRLPGPSMVSRPVGQTLALPRLARRGVDAVLATNPTTSLRRVGAPLAVVVHDLRHELRPEQFSRPRRALRWASYGRSYALANGFVAVSQRTFDDLHRLHPSTRSVPSRVVHHGADHVRDWPAPTRLGPWVAFGHHTNKNPALVLEAWSLLSDPPPLVVLGLGAGSRAELERRRTALGLNAVVELAPFLPDEQFRAVLAGARGVVLASDLEGFGLPVVEAMALGKPVVVGPDPGTAEVAGGHAVAAAGWTAEAFADAVRRAVLLSDAELAPARAHAETFTWARAARQTRAFLAELVEGCRDTRVPG